MNRIGRIAAAAGREVLGAAATFALWVVWALLGALLVGQIYIASHNEVSVPGFVLRRLESRLAENGMRVTFENATFDPTGRILVRSPRVFLPEFEDPVGTARAAYVGLDPWALLTGHLDIGEVQLLGGTVMIPAMLSPSGRAEPMIGDVDAVVVPGQREVRIQTATGRIGGLFLSVRGAISRVKAAGGLPRAPATSTARSRFADICRTAVEVTKRIDAFDEPVLNVELEPSPAFGAAVSADLVARGFKLDGPVAAHAAALRVQTRLPLFGNAPFAARVRLEASDLQLPHGLEARGLTAELDGQWVPAERKLDPREIDLTAESVTANEGDAGAISVVARAQAWTRWEADAVGRVLGSVLDLDGDADLQAKTATVNFRGAVSPQVLAALNRHVRVDVRKFFNFAGLDVAAGFVQFGPDWKFQRLSAHVAMRGIDAYGVPMQEGGAVIELDPHRLYAPDAYVRLGDDFARGTYEQIFATNQFRFLLDGRLRPLDIAPWFREWWSNFFDRFGFPTEPPDASVDVQGVWREGRRTSVFVFADAQSPIIQGRKLKHVRTRIFVRPGFYDGLELFGTDLDGGDVRGTFNVATNLDSELWRSVAVDTESTIGLPTVAAMLGDVGEPFLAPFALVNRPTVKFRLHLDGPDLAVRHQNMDLTARSAGGFKYHDFPLDDVAFTAVLRDDDLAVDSTQAKFAGGSVLLHAKVTGKESDRRVLFDVTLNDASLGEAVNTLQQFAAKRKGLPPPPPGKFVQEKANVRMDLTASAQGKYDDLLSYHGGGKVALRGPEIGEVPLFGPLSALLKFTALRFTNAHATYRINGPTLEFSEVALRGANSAVDAHGDYALDRHQLDFRAKVFPFQESGSVIKSVVGAVLTPISNALEVKLTGTLDKPDWAFVIGPTNLLRSLAPAEPQTAATGPTGTPASTATPPLPAAAASGPTPTPPPTDPGRK